MCWNAEISISTFIFACAATLIGLVTKVLDWRWSIALMTIASMQLLEFFIWKYGLTNAQLNRVLSIIGLTILFLQPAALGLVIENDRVKYAYYALYAVFVVVALLMQNKERRFTTGVAPNNHLQWNWMNMPGVLAVLWVLFVVAAIMLSNQPLIVRAIYTFISLAFMAISYYYFRGQGTWGTVYCSFVNLIFTVVLIRAFWGQYSCMPRMPPK